MANGIIDPLYEILYNTPFQNGTVTLKKNISNYKYVEITFSNSVYRIDTNYNSSAKTAMMITSGFDTANSNNPGIIMSFLGIQISSNTFKVNNHYRLYHYNNNASPNIDSTLYGWITEIRGYY